MYKYVKKIKFACKEDYVCHSGNALIKKEKENILCHNDYKKCLRSLRVSHHFKPNVKENKSEKNGENITF